MDYCFSSAGSQAIDIFIIMRKNTEKLIVRTLEKDHIEDFITLIDLFEKVFEMQDFKRPETEYLLNLLSKPGFKAIAGYMNGEIVAGATIYVLDQYNSTRPLAYIYDLAVSNEHQRKGIGKSVMEYIRTHYKSLGFEEVFVQADEDEDHVLKFYRSTFPTEEEKVRHFNYRL